MINVVMIPIPICDGANANGPSLKVAPSSASAPPTWKNIILDSIVKYRSVKQHESLCTRVKRDLTGRMKMLNHICLSVMFFCVVLKNKWLNVAASSGPATAMVRSSEPSPSSTAMVFSLMNKYLRLSFKSWTMIRDRFQDGDFPVMGYGEKSNYLPNQIKLTF